GGGHRVGAPLRPLHRVVHRPDLPDPEPRHQFLRLGEGAVGHPPLGPIEVDALPELARLEPVACEHGAMATVPTVAFFLRLRPPVRAQEEELEGPNPVWWIGPFRSAPTFSRSARLWLGATPV